MTETSPSHPAAAYRSAEPAARSQLGSAVRRARWSIFWERLWPALARLAAVIGLFLTVSWLGLWLWLPPLARAAGLVLFGILAIASIIPFVSLRLPVAADALRRLDRGSGVRHRPATTIADELAVTAADPYSLALWQAHVERTLAAARAFKAGWPSPRLALRDPYALRGLILVAVIATFIAAGGEHLKRVAAAFDWQGVVLPANFRVDAWVTPPAYTGRPPVILAGMHPGEIARQDLETNEPVSVPVGSTLVVRATGKLNLDMSGKGGVTAAIASAANTSSPAARASGGRKSHKPSQETVRNRPTTTASRASGGQSRSQKILQRARRSAVPSCERPVPSPMRSGGAE